MKTEELVALKHELCMLLWSDEKIQSEQQLIAFIKEHGINILADAIEKSNEIDNKSSVLSTNQQFKVKLLVDELLITLNIPNPYTATA